MVLLFQTVKQAIGSIFGVANNEKYKVHLFEVVHCIQPPGQPYDCVVFILTRAVVKYNVNSPPTEFSQRIYSLCNVSTIMREATLLEPFLPIPHDTHERACALTLVHFHRHERDSQPPSYLNGL